MEQCLKLGQSHLALINLLATGWIELEWIQSLYIHVEREFCHLDRILRWILLAF